MPSDLRELLNALKPGAMGRTDFQDGALKGARLALESLPCRCKPGIGGYDHLCRRCALLASLSDDPGVG
jgi:hypothetical protein